MKKNEELQIIGYAITPFHYNKSKEKIFSSIDAQYLIYKTRKDAEEANGILGENIKEIKIIL